MKRSMELLPQISLGIMMALSLKPRHGYEIMQQVAEDSSGRIKLGPGSLYSSVKQLSEAGFIEETPSKSDRRRYYRLTKKGWKRLKSELDYFDETLNLARQRKVFRIRVF